MHQKQKKILKEIYDYHKQTGVYLRTRHARPDPLHPGRWLIPANATDIKPPPAEDGFVPVWSGVKWELFPDNRGPAWKTKNGRPVTIHHPGPLPAGVTLLEPPKFPKWSIDHWETDIEQLRHAKKRELLRIAHHKTIALAEPARLLAVIGALTRAASPAAGDAAILAAWDDGAKLQQFVATEIKTLDAANLTALNQYDAETLAWPAT